MPYRSYRREQDWLLPPSLGEMIPEDHPVRFVAETVDQLDLAEIGIEDEANALGAAAYAPRMLLAAWVYGFMIRVRSSRKLEQACRENIPLLWLTGVQRPDHSTLARFYQKYRPAMRMLFKTTVRLAMDAGLVEFAVQAVDGTRLAAAARASWRSQADIGKLLAQVEAEIAALEAAEQAEAGAEGGPPKGPRSRLGREQVRVRLQQALAEKAQREAAAGRQDADKISATDPEAAWMKANGGWVVGYNAQAVVDSKAQIIVGADVTNSPSDGEQLLPMLQEAQAMTGHKPAIATADSGYFAIGAIVEAEAQGSDVYVPQPKKTGQKAAADRYHKQHFTYDAAADAYICPEGQRLTFRYLEHQHNGKPAEVRTYQGWACRDCPIRAQGLCTKAEARQIKRYPYDAALPAHVAKMQSDQALEILGQRSSTVEPVFADTKERLGMRRFLLRGLANVRGEWRLTCAMHNLIQIWRHWWCPERKRMRLAAAA